MLKVLTCSFVKWLTIKCQSCCSLTNFLLTIFFSSTYELPVINLLFALKFCFCKKLPHFNEHAAAAIQVWFAANSPLFCADACWDSGECLGFQMIPANQSTDCSQISACCPSAGKTLWMIEGKNKEKKPQNLTDDRFCCPAVTAAIQSVWAGSRPPSNDYRLTDPWWESWTGRAHYCSWSTRTFVLF